MTKCDFFELHKATLHLVEWRFELIFCLLKSQTFVGMKSIKLCFKSSHGTLKSFSGYWAAQNMTSVWLIKLCFIWSPGTANKFCAS